MPVITEYIHECDSPSCLETVIRQKYGPPEEWVKLKWIVWSVTNNDYPPHSSEGMFCSSICAYKYYRDTLKEELKEIETRVKNMEKEGAS